MATEALFINMQKLAAKYEVELYLLVSLSNESYWRMMLPDISIIKIPLETKNPFMRVILERIACSWAIKKIDADIFYSFSGTLPLLKNACKTIVYFQNILFFHYHEFYNRKKMKISRINWILKHWLWDYYSRQVCTNAMKSATEVIAISEWMASELHQFTGVIRKRSIHIVPYGINDSFHPNISTNSPAITPYIVSVSSVLPHKNYESCVKIFASLKIRYRVPHKLYIVGGGPVEYMASLVKLSSELDVKDSICFAGPVENVELARWYVKADAFILTSLCESLGFTVIEAMASGIPVIISNKSGLPDTVSNAGVVEDPFRTDIFADKLYELLFNEKIRKKYIQKGLKRASEFSWNNAAEDTMGIVKGCLQ